MTGKNRLNQESKKMKEQNNPEISKTTNHDELYDKIITTYQECNSVKKAAEILGTTLVKAQRVLITEGFWSSDRSDEVGKLFEKGLSVSEIANKLYISEKTVQAYLPYTKGIYNKSNPSDDSKKSSSYRSRNQEVAKKQVINRLEGGAHMLKEKVMPTQSKPHKVYKLRLELNLHLPSEEEAYILKKYGHMKDGLIREILVPDDITLYALHFAIQKCFGFQNSHLHSFILPDYVYDNITGGTPYTAEELYRDGLESASLNPDKDIYIHRYPGGNGQFINWVKLCGLYFRFPSENYDDIYWDDDYDGKKSFNTFLKSKYNIKKQYGGHMEHRVVARRMAEDFLNNFPKIRVKSAFNKSRDLEKEGKPTKGQKEGVTKDMHSATIDEVKKCFADFFPDELLERLELSEVLFPSYDEEIDLNEIKELTISSEDDYREYLNKEYIDNQGDIRKDIVLSNHQEVKHTSEDIYSKYDTPVKPITDTLIYRYDYGDDWMVGITIVDEYEVKENNYNNSFINSQIVYNHAGVRVIGEEADDILNTYNTRELRCTYVDGLNLVDDVGGVYGFVNMLKTIYDYKLENSDGNIYNNPDDSTIEYDDGEREEYIVWSKNMRWKDKLPNPKTLL